LPPQVPAAFFIASFSNPFEGSPGTVWKRHSSFPVAQSNAAIEPRAVFRARRADEHLAVRDARRAGDRVAGVIGHHLLAPGDRAVLLVEGHEEAVERRDENLVSIKRDAAIDRVAAGHRQRLARHLRVVRPLELAGAGIVGVDLAPRRRDVEHAVVHQRRRFLPARGVEVGRPGEAEPADGLVAHLRQRAEALLAVIAPVAQPLVAVGCRDHRVGDAGGRRGRALRGFARPVRLVASREGQRGAGRNDPTTTQHPRPSQD
jgi:hypothetical protein